MKVSCPSCGAEVEFRYDDSFVRVCGHCNAAVLRTDRGIETLGKLADLIPIESQLKLFAEGHAGNESFLLVGMAQFRHSGGGVWQEWYAKFDGGKWGWVAEAQGRLYLTFEAAGDHEVPQFANLRPGAVEVLHGHSYTVGELGEAEYVSALGEIPYRLDPTARFKFADLSDGAGAFATIDYGDGAEAPTLYTGRQATPAELRISGGESQPQLERREAGAKLACPNCNGALELRAPDVTLRVACPYCNTLVGVESGNLTILTKLASKPTLEIPLGSKCTFSEGELTVIGYVGRSALVDSTWYPFYEYLLYEPKLGFRWLVSSDGHWNYVQPIAPGAVQGTMYGGTNFKLFQISDLRVDEVYGELYWAVAVGERIHSEDLVAPPAMLSREYNNKEENWSLSTYLTIADVKAAFKGVELQLSPTIGIAPNQPYRLKGAGWVTLGIFAVLIVVGIVAASRAKNEVKYTQSVTIGPKGSTNVPTEAPAPTPTPAPTTTPPAEAETPGTVTFSDKAFHLDGGKNIEITATAPVTNNWAYVAVDLVNQATGEVVSYDESIEYYSGVDDGESWDEGSRSASQMLAPMPAGDYLLRVEGQQGGDSNLIVGMIVTQGIFRPLYLLLAMLFLGIPFGWLWLHGRGFEKKRWENSSTSPTSSGSDDDDDDDDSGDSGSAIGVAGAVLGGLLEVLSD